MAMVISSVTVTGTATAYTVPSDKVAKVRITSIQLFKDNAVITIGNYVSKNTVTNDLDTKNCGETSTTTNSISYPVLGFVRCSVSGNNMQEDYMYVKEDHVLVEGQTVAQSNASTVVSYTIFEDDA